MNCFILRATSVDGKIYPFSMEDLPVPISTQQFVLMRTTPSPILSLSSIRRGDPETGLFEGDVIDCDGERYLICYERGFYAISDDYIIKHFSMLKNWKVIGDQSLMPNISIKFKAKHIFKYNNVYFYMNDIMSSVNDKLLIRLLHEPIDPKLVKHCCGASYFGERLYFDDQLDGGIVTLQGGRVMIPYKGKLTDITTLEVQ